MEQNLRAPKLSMWLLAILAALVASAHASAINLNRDTYKGCVKECQLKDNSIFNSGSGLTGLWRKARASDDQTSVQFELGKTYSYRVQTQSEARTIFALNEQQNTRDGLIGLQATAWITPISECELSMQLKNIRIEGTVFAEQSDEADLIQQLEVPILFGYQNGVVSEVCTDLGEESFVLNLKKSIISALQTIPQFSNTDRVKVIEPDFNGECETEYTVEKQSWNKFVVRKQKDLNQCQNPAEQVDTYSNWKNALLKHNPNSMAECEQTIESRQIKTAKCQSVRTVNTVMPHFAVELVSSVEIKSEDVFEATSEKRSAQVPSQWQRHPHRLMMSQPTAFFGLKKHQQKQQRIGQLADGRVQLKTVLDQICDDIKTHGQRVTTKTAHFVQILAETLKQSSQEDVEFVWKNIVQTRNICGQDAKKVQDIFVDTAASVMNRNSATIVRDQLIKFIERAQQHQDKSALQRARSLATVIAFAYQPTAEAVRQIVPELIEKTDDAQIILSLTALVKKTHEELKDARFVEQLYETVLRKVVSRLSRQNVKEIEVEIVRLLTALENIEPKTMVAGQDRLIKITTDKRLTESIRVAAIKSAKHIEMEDKLRQTLLAIFTDRSEKNECRIAAYRTLIFSKITVQELQQIRKVIEQDTQNQDVHNYVCSHQQNLRTTNDLKKRALLPLEAPVFPEPQSIANFLLSRNLENTIVDSKTKVGAIIEADLIMEQESRVPRSVTFNLTVPVAEQEIPIVELTIRQQGLEKSLMERLEKIKQIKSPAHMIREVSQMIRAQQKHQQKQYRSQEEQGQMQIYVNVDGKNVYIWDSLESQKERQYDQFETVFAQLLKQLPIQIDETMVMMPLKHKVRLPTASGIPVNFELNTTLIASLEADLKGAENMLEAHIKPTFILEHGFGLEAEIAFEGQQNKRVQFVNRFITAPTFHVKAQVKPDSRDIRVKVLMPEDEQIIARFETEYNNDQDQQIELLSEVTGMERQAIKKHYKRQMKQWYGADKSEEKCLPMLDQMLGFTYCVQRFTVDDLKQSLSSRRANKLIYRSQIKLVKTDRQMEGIEFGVQLPELFTPQATADEFKFIFHFDTPNSRVSRRFNTELVIRVPQQSNDKFLVQLDIDSPVKKFAGQFMLINQEQQKGIKIELVTDRDQRQFLLEANAFVQVQARDNQQVKLQLRLQPTAESKMIEVEGELVMQLQNELKQKVQLKLKNNEKEILDVQLVKSGSLSKPIDCKMSATFKLDLFGAKIQWNSLVNKNQQTGTIKSTGELKYNRFFAFRARSDEETISYQFQFSGLNQQEKPDKKYFIHWTLQASQFPQLKHELTYNIKDTREGISQELNLKWSQETQRVHFVHESKTVNNPRTKITKLLTTVEIEVTPLNFHHDVQFVLDLPDFLFEKPPHNYAFELKAQNRKTSEMTIEARLAYTVSSKDPLKQEGQGEIKLRNGKYVLKFRDNVSEVSRRLFQGQTAIELVQGTDRIHPMMPKKIQMTYTLKQLETPVHRLPEIEGREVLNLVARFFNLLEKFERELIIETEAHGKIRHTYLLAVNEQDQWKFNSQLEREQQVIYKKELEVLPHDRILKVKFETEKLNHLEVQFKTQLKEELKKFDFKVQSQRVQHHTRFVMDKQQDKFEFVCQTKKGQQVVFELDAKKDGKVAQMKVQSEWVEAEIELENVQPRMIRSMLKKRSFDLQQEESQVKIAVKLPRIELQHKTELKCKPAQRQLIITSETRKQDRNVLKFQMNLHPEEKSLVAEYKNGYIANLKLSENVQQEIYEFVADYRIDSKQWFHKTVAKWQFDQRSQTTRGDSWIVPLQFRLISLEMKNHLGQKNVFDLTYKCNEQNQSAEYAHEFILSTRDSHAELRLSRFGFDYNQQYAPKALFTFKTKKWGGVEHKTELKQVDLEKRQLKLYSNTVSQGEIVAQIECNLALQRGQQSVVKVQLAQGHQIDIQFVPFEWIEVQCNFRNQWKHTIRFERKASQQQWTGKIESFDLRTNEQWNARVQHQCDQATTAEIDTPIVRGNIEVRVDNKKIRIDLKGGKQWSGLELKCDAQWDKDAKKFVIKSTTVKQGKPFVFVDAELYASLQRTSTFKVEIEPIRFKCNVQCDPLVGLELQVVAKQWKHQMQIKKRSSELLVQSETRKDDEVIVLFETELSPKKSQFKCELGQFKRFSPISMKGKIDLVDKELQFQAHHKDSDRLIKFETKAKDLKNVHVEFAWDAKRDQSKQVLIQVRIQDKESSPERFIASIRGDIIDRPFEIKIDVPRQAKVLLRSSFSIEAELKNRKTNDQYIAKYIRKYDQEQQKCQGWIEVRKNDFTFIKTHLMVNLQQENQKAFTYKVESDIKTDLLNFELELTRDCAYKQCQTKAFTKYGAEEKKEIKFEGANVADALRGELVINTPRLRQQTIKFEFIKPESKLQINVFNQAGRQLDFNVDLARPLQKKFQIESFLESIPTVDVEVAHGENSRLVIQVSFQQEKKMELAINWFGQWRRDFKLEALFKCFSKPSIEMLITSRHPAGVDEIDAMLKVAAKEYVAKWSRKFDQSKKNWNTKTLIKVNGEKKVDLQIECVTKQEDSDREIKSFKAQLDGVRRATGQLTVVLRKQTHETRFPLTKIEMVQCELGNDRQPRLVAFDLFVRSRDQQQSTIQSGIKLAVQDKPIFGLVLITSDRLNGQNKRTTMIRLELPEQIEYVLRNEIEYEQHNQEQIKSIRSELKKKQNSVQPIYQTRIVFGEDKQHDMKVMRIEINSARFTKSAQVASPKVIEIRYNFKPKQCQTIEAVHQHQRNIAYGEAKCWRVELLAGQSVNFQQQQQEQDQFERTKQFDIKMGAEWVKMPIDSSHHNRTIRFTLEAIPKTNELSQEQLIKLNPISFELIGHVSHRSFGIQWDNRNRHGEHKHGMVYLDAQQINSKQSMVNLYIRDQNKQQPAKDIAYELHFSPQEVRRTVRMAAKWDQGRVRRWVVGEMPKLEEIAREKSMRDVRTRMMREIKEEIAHKLTYLQENYNNELVQPIMEELREIQQQLQESEDRVAREMFRLSKRAAEKVTEVYDSIDMEQALGELYQIIADSIEQTKRQLIDSVLEKCHQNKGCQRVIDQIRDYEIEKFVQKNIFDRAQQMQQSLEKAMPADLLKSFKELARQFNAAHDEETKQQWQEEENKTSRRFMRHGARLLKMAQPEMSETFVKHMNKISKHFDNDDEDQYNQRRQQQQQQQVNWNEVRGAVHDMAVDMVDVMQEKSKQQEKKPFWNQFYGGSQQQQQGANGFDYSKYTSKWQSQGGQQKYGQDMDDQQETPIKSNFMFSPKRGEFKLLDSTTTQATSSYWTRS